MIIADPQARQAFVESFASLTQEGSAGATHTDSESSVDIASTVDDPDFPGAVLSRTVRARVIYYALADSGPDWRQLAPLLSSFVGVTITDFRGRTTPLDPDDPLEAFLQSYGFAAVSRFSAGSQANLELLASRALTRLREMLHRAETPVRQLPRSTREVLRAFQFALVGLDRNSAEDAIRFLTDNLRLDALNLAFLQVQVDARFGDWAQLLSRPFFPSLTLTRRPPSVTGALIEALYHSIIDPFEAANDVDGAVTAFDQELHPRAGNLFRGQPSLTDPVVGKAYLLSAMTSGVADRAALKPLVEASASWSDGDRRFFEQCLTRVEWPPKEEPPHFVHHGLSIFGTGSDLRAQFSLIVQETRDPTVAQAKAVLFAAVQLQTLDAYGEAVEYVSRLPAAGRESLLATPGVRGLWEDIERYTSNGSVPRTWTDWLSALDKLDYRQARDLAEAATKEWPVADHLRNAQDVSRLAAALQSANEDRLVDALPYIVDWLRSDPHYPNPAYDSLYDIALTQMLLSTRLTQAALATIAQLFDARLSLGLATADYELLLNGFAGVVGELASARTVDWLLDIAELTVLHPSPSTEARAAFWLSLMSAVRPFGVRLTRAQRNVASDLARILGAAEQLVDLQEPEKGGERALNPALSSVAIYTLTEAIGQRIRSALVSEFPQLRVELVHDVVNSPRLSELARRADLFVVCWQSAKHAATNAVRAVRPPTMPTLYPTGKGSSSILAEIRDQLLDAPA